MKRTLTGVVAASMVLGSFAPAAFAATSSPYQWSHRAIENNGKAISALNNVPGFTYNGTYYISVYDVQYLLNQLGFTSTWDNGTLNITTTNPVDSSKLPANQPSGANAFIKVNGTQVFKGNHIVVTPPGGKFATSFMQVFDLQQVLNALGLNASDYEGSAGLWNIVSTPTYGAAAGVKVSAAKSSVVADNADTDTLTLTVVDSNGNTVADYNGPVKVYLQPAGANDTLTEADGTTKATGSLSAPLTYTASNGKVTVTLNAGNTASASDVVYAGVPDSSGNVDSWTSSSISTVAPTATSVGISAAKTLNSSADDVSGLPVTVQVLDQAGNPVSSGSYLANVTLSGPAKFSDGTQGPEALAVGPSGTITIYPDSASSTGTITVTASVSGLTSVPGAITAYVPGSAAKLGLSTQPTTTSFTADTVGASTAGSPFQTYAVQAEDANGYGTTTSAPASVTAQVTVNGQPSTAIGVVNTSGVVTATSTPVTVDPSSGVYNVQLGLISGQKTIPAGTYTVTVNGGSGVGTLTETFTVTAGKAHTVAITPASGATYDVAVSNPTATVQAQLQDAWGNNVAQSGIVVDFANGGSNAPTLSTTQVATNASGVASVTATEPATAGDSGYVTGVIDGTSAANNNLTGVSTTPVDSATFEVANATVSNVTAKANYASNATSFTAGGTDTFTVSTTDASGYPITGDTVDYTITGPGNTDISSSETSGTISTSALTAAGAYTLKVKDVSAPSQPSYTLNFNVSASTFHGFDFFNNGTDVSTNGLSLSAGQSATLSVLPVDTYGNVVAAPGNYTVTLPSTDTDVSFSAATVKVAPGTAGTSVNVFANGNDTTGNLASTDFAISTWTPAAATATFSPTSTTFTTDPTAVTPEAYLVVVKDGTGAVLANQTVTLTLGANGGSNGSPIGSFASSGSQVTTITVTTNANGQAAFTYYTPNNGASGDKDLITATIPGSAGAVSLGTLAINY